MASVGALAIANARRAGIRSAQSFGTQVSVLVYTNSLVGNTKIKSNGGSAK